MISGQGFSNRGDLRKSVRLNFKVKKGDTFTYSLDIYAVDANGEEQTVDLTGYKAQGRVKRKDGSTLFWFLFTLSGHTMTVTRPDMKNYPAGKYQYDIEIKDRDGNQVTHLEGDFVIEQDITEFVETMYEYFVGKFRSIIKIENPIVAHIREKISFTNKILLQILPHYRFKGIFKSSLQLIFTPFAKLLYTNKFFSSILIQSAIHFRQSVKSIFKSSFSIMPNPLQNLQCSFYTTIKLEFISD